MSETPVPRTDAETVRGLDPRALLGRAVQRPEGRAVTGSAWGIMNCWSASRRAAWAWSLKCLQKAPADRYASAEELAADLERWLAGKPVHARPVSTALRLRLWSRRNSAAAIAGVLLLMLAAVASVAAVRLRGQRDEINEGLARSLLAQAYAQRLGTAPERRPQNLRVLAEAALIRPSLKLRNEAIATLALPALGPPQTWHAGERQLHNHQRMLSADGERYALFGQSQGVTVYQRREGTVLAELLTPPGHLFIGFFSPDGRFFINYDQARNVFVWDLSLATGGPLPHSRVVPGPWEYYGDFTPDSRALALPGKDSRVHFFDLESGAERMSAFQSGHPARHRTRGRPVRLHLRRRAVCVGAQSCR